MSYTAYLRMVSNSPQATILDCYMQVNSSNIIQNVYDYSQPTGGGYVDILLPITPAVSYNNGSNNNYPINGGGSNIHSQAVLNFLKLTTNFLSQNTFNLFKNDDYLALTNFERNFYSGVYNFTITTQLTPFSDPGVLCILSTTNILTLRGQIPIKDLTKTDRVICLDAIRDIHTLSSSKVNHTLKEPILYQHANSNLILTKDHSLLLSTYDSNEQKDNVEKYFGLTCITGGMVRVPACLSNSMKVYEVFGAHTVYHIALQSEDVDINYAIFADNILVETCQISQINKMSTKVF